MSQIEMTVTETELEVINTFELKNVNTEMSVREVLQLIKNRELGLRTEQRPFRYDKEQFKGIVSSIISGFMYAPIVLCDINSSLARAINDGNTEDIQYFTGLIGGKTVLRTVEDGQHRVNYFTTAKTNLDEETFNTLMDCTIPVVLQVNYTLDDITRAFNYTNSGNKIKNQDLVWSNVTSFNTQLKDLTEDLGLKNYSRKRDIILKIRDSYKFLLKSLKVVAHMEGMHSIDARTGDKSLVAFVKRDLNVSQFDGVVDCIRTMMTSVVNGTLNDCKEDYAKYNLLFSIHTLKVNNIESSLEEITEHVNQFPNDDYFGSRNSSVVKRYKLVRDRILETYAQQEA